ncbi:MAG TPA: glycosyltransferase family 2 protein [Candidatus Binatia bacterium]|nr:glycosyltransferase family 2 protein [Candidatus Binatia bacterium]
MFGFTFLEILPYILVIALISLIDFVTLARSRFIKPTKITQRTPMYHDYSILIPIFGDMSYLKNVKFLSRYKSHVILCTTTKESPEFNQEITRVAEKYGFKIYRSEVPLASQKSKPNPWRLFQKTLHGETEVNKIDESVVTIDSAEGKINVEIARDEIIRDSFAAVQTEYCIFLDGDTVARHSMDKLVGLMIERKLDLASVRVLASKKETVMEKLQSIEYEFAMDARKVYPWLTSGASMVAKTEVIKEIMSHHSLFFSGGDIEIGKLARMLNFKVGHIDFEFFTDVPATFKAWFKQRMAWFGGGFRHAVINMHQYSWRHPLFYFYTTFLVYLLTPLRWYEVIKRPLVIPLIVLLYWGLLLLFRGRQMRWYYLLFPFYALTQIMILPICGAYTYFKMANHANNVGMIKLRHPINKPNAQIVKQKKHAPVGVDVPRLRPYTLG